MGRIFLVRHGQTAWNKARIFRGRRDVQLNELGRREAAAAARALRDEPLSAVYSSPLSRARETAEAVAGMHDLSVQTDAAFLDIDYGAWTEYWDMEVRRKFREMYELWETEPHRVQFPGGESLAQVRERAVPRLKALARRHRDETVAVVSHRTVLKVILCAVKGWDDSRFWDVRLDTCAICLLESNRSQLRVVAENETKHLHSLVGHDSVDF